MKTSVQQEIATLENELKLKAMLGREYFSDESQALKLKLNELRQIEISKILNGLS